MAIEQRLRVTQAVTTNGKTQRIDENGRVVQKVSILPVRAKRELDSNNARYEDALKMKIEVVQFDTKKQQVVEAGAVKEDAPTEKPKRGRGGKKVTADELDDIFGK